MATKKPFASATRSPTCVRNPTRRSHRSPRAGVVQHDPRHHHVHAPALRVVLGARRDAARGGQRRGPDGARRARAHEARVRGAQGPGLRHLLRGRRRERGLAPRRPQRDGLQRELPRDPRRRLRDLQEARHDAARRRARRRGPAPGPAPGRLPRRHGQARPRHHALPRERRLVLLRDPALLRRALPRGRAARDARELDRASPAPPPFSPRARATRRRRRAATRSSSPRSRRRTRSATSRAASGPSRSRPARTTSASRRTR